mgnify:CR=1 FL=1|jgi:hypothetical protein|tara:strand:+ start:2320 stop:2724 length:405 start_codon:yes stop_codon:yes gene_type:complete
MTRINFHQQKLPLQFDRPVFVRVEFTSAGRVWRPKDEYKWKEIGVEERAVLDLYSLGFLHHSSDLEVKAKVGDGLEALDVTGLHDLVDSINKKVEAKTNSKASFDKMKCKKSKVLDKQRGLIRSWRRNYGHMEN